MYGKTINYIIQAKPAYSKKKKGTSCPLFCPDEVEVLDFGDFKVDDHLCWVDHLMQYELANERGRGKPDCDGGSEHTFMMVE